MYNDFLWTEKYSPSTVDDVILPNHIKDAINSYIFYGQFPNLLFYGAPGVGKTTVAKLLCTILNMDYVLINASLHGNIDTLRVDILQFVTSGSFMSRRKCVILDEADYLNPSSTQPALRNFMDEHSSKVSFILTANYKNKIIAPLRSRCSEISFTIPKKDRPAIAKNMYLRLMKILSEENVEADHSIITEVVKTYFPDFRKMISELQANVVDKKIDTSVFMGRDTYSMNDLINFMKEKNFGEVRKLVASNNIPSEYVFSYFFQNASKFVKPHSIPQLILLAAKYQYQDAFVLDKEINLMAFLVEIMADCVFL